MPTKINPCPQRTTRNANARRLGLAELDPTCPGCPECTTWAQQELLDKFAAVLDAPNFSHVTVRSWCGADIYYAYRREPASPTQCELEWSVAVSPEADALLEARGLRAQPAGMRGYGACAAQLRGR